MRLVIDGLDEWAASDQRDLLKDLAQLTSTDPSAYICKIIIASRDTFEIARSLRRRYKMAMPINLSDEEERNATTLSIRHLVDDEFSKLSEYFRELDPDGSVTSQIKLTISEKAHGNMLRPPIFPSRLIPF